jgi:PIN domain nuclease of toxin-antitoxin system
MASRTYLDTHVAVWLYSGRTKALTARARRALTAGGLYLSPMVILEIDFLREIGRVNQSGESVFGGLSKRSGLAISETPFADVVFEASTLSWTKDPFDRIIVAEAALHDAPLVTKDPNIHAHYKRALWE